MAAKRSYDRREFVKGTVIAGTVFSLAGCNSLGDPEDDSDDEPEDSDDSGDDSGESDDSNEDGGLALGDEIEGELTADAPTDPIREQPAVPYELEVGEEQWVNFSLESGDFDSYLVVTDEAGDLVARNDDSTTLHSRVATRLSPGEQYTVWAGSFFDDGTGSFTLSVTRMKSSSRPERTSLSVGETVTGTVDDSAPTDPVRSQPAVPYSLEVSEDQWVRLSQESDEIDSFLLLTNGSGGLVAEHDDSGTSLDSEIQTSVSAGEMYTIWAGSFLQSDMGDFSLSVTAATAATGDGGGSISVGDSIGGRIRSDSPTDPVRDGKAVPYTLEVEEERRVEISLVSEVVDSYLVVTDGEETVVDEDDDSGAVTDSRLTMTVAADETYTVWAGSSSTDDTGRFTLSVSATSPSTPVDPGSITVGESLTGTILSDSPRDPVRDQLAIPYTLEVTEERAVEIAQRSNDIDSYLLVTDGTGDLVAEDDDSGPSADSQLTTTLAADETYTIWAGSFSRGEIGSFTLSVSATEGPMVDHLGTITVGESVTGEIRADSPQDPIYVQPAAPYSLEVSEEQTVEILQQSEEIDCVLSVVDGNGELVAFDDNSAPTRFDSRVTITVAPNFDYTIWAGSYGLNGTGTFTLTVNRI